MAVTVVQSIAHVGNPPATFGAGVTAGNTVFLVAAGYTTASGNPTISAVKLGGSTVAGTIAFFGNGTTDGILSPLSGSNGAYLAIIMIPNVPGGGTAVTYTAAGFSGIIGQCIYEVAGLGSNPILDKSNNGSSASGTAVNSGASGAITSATEIVFGGTMAFAGTPATNSGWVCLQPGGGTDLTAGYQLPVSSGGSYTWAQTSSGNPWAAFVTTVKPSPTPAPFYAPTQAQAKLIIPLLTGRVRSSPGAPVNNPGVVPVSGSLPGAVRAALPANLRGAVIVRSRPRVGPPAHAATVALTVTPSFTVASARGHYRSGSLPVTPSFTVATSGGGSAAALARPQGGWWQLDAIIKDARQELEFYATQPPAACPRCGEPLRPAPPSDSGSGVELYCRFDGWQYPRDWTRPPI